MLEKEMVVKETTWEEKEVNLCGLRMSWGPQSLIPRLYLHRKGEEKVEATMQVTQGKCPQVFTSLIWVSGYFSNLINPDNWYGRSSLMTSTLAPLDRHCFSGWGECPWSCWNWALLSGGVSILPPLLPSHSFCANFRDNFKRQIWALLFRKT